jgi:glycosyltransferase 2 family protein
VQDTPEDTGSDDAKATRVSARRIAMRVFVVAFAASLLYLAFRGVDWSELGALLSSARVELVVLAWTIMLAATAVRAFRWRLLLGETAQPPYLTMFWATMAGYVGNAYLPARAGDVLRSILLGRHLGIARSFVFGTTITERVLDTIVVVALAGGIVSWIPQTPDWLASAAGGLSLAAAAALILLLAAPRLAGWIERMSNRLPVRESLRAALVHVWHEFFTGSRAIQNHGTATAFGLLSLAVWTMDTMTILVLASALGLAAMTPELALLLVVALALSSVAPSTPGYVGVYQFVAVSVLGPFAIAQSEALALVLIFQGLVYLVVTPFGLIGLAMLGGLGAARANGQERA